MITVLNNIQSHLVEFLAANSSVPLLTVDSQQRIVACNDGFLRLFSLKVMPVGIALSDFLVPVSGTVVLSPGEQTFTSNPRTGLHGQLVAHCLPYHGGLLLWCERLLTTNNQVVEQMALLNNELIAIQRELAKKNHQLQHTKQELAQKVAELELALTQVKRLEGIIPICMFCKKIRDTEDLWHQLEQYLSEHSDAEFSHGMCPECFEKKYSNNAHKS